MVTNFQDGVSIITIVLNGEKYIEDTIKSVISQKGVYLEYIIIDGGSSDNTLNLINKYNEYISRVVSEPDGGIYQAINKGISHAQCSLIGILNCGDCFLPGTISTVYQAFMATEADIIYGDIQVKEEFENCIYIKKLIADHFQLKSRMSIFHPSTFVKHNKYLELGVYDVTYKLASDYDLFLNFYLKGCIYFHISAEIAIFRLGGISSSRFNLSIKENYLIRKRRIGTLYAVKYAGQRILNFVYFEVRRSLVRGLLGKKFYLLLKIKFKNHKYEEK